MWTLSIGTHSDNLKPMKTQKLGIFKNIWFDSKFTEPNEMHFVQVLKTVFNATDSRNLCGNMTFFRCLICTDMWNLYQMVMKSIELFLLCMSQGAPQLTFAFQPICFLPVKNLKYGSRIFEYIILKLCQNVQFKNAAGR